jgi:hypothetical protein
MLGLVLLSSLAQAGLEGPLDDERRVVTGRLGSGVFTVTGRGLYATGKRTDLGDFTQGGGEVAFDFAGVVGPTALGGMFGLEGEFLVGLMRTEAYANGALRDQRDDSDAADPAKMWATTRLGLRYVLSPPPLFVGGAAFRLGLVGGLQLEGSGARSWTMAGAFTAGAHLAFGTESMGALLSWLAVPPQGEDSVLVRHQVSLDFGFGSFTVGARVQFDHVDTRALRGLPKWALDSTTFSLAVGYRGPELKL